MWPQESQALGRGLARGEARPDLLDTIGSVLRQARAPPTPKKGRPRTELGWRERPDLQQQQVLRQQVQQEQDLAVQLLLAQQLDALQLAGPLRRHPARQQPPHSTGWGRRGPVVRKRSHSPHPYTHPTHPKPWGLTTHSLAQEGRQQPSAQAGQVHEAWAGPRNHQQVPLMDAHQGHVRPQQA